MYPTNSSLNLESSVESPMLRNFLLLTLLPLVSVSCGSFEEKVQIENKVVVQDIGSLALLNPNAINVASMSLYATFHHIGVQMCYTGDENKNATVSLEANIDGRGFRLAQEMSRTREGQFMGIVFSILPNTLVDIRAIARDPDGVSNGIQLGTTKTRVDNQANDIKGTLSAMVASTAKVESNTAGIGHLAINSDSSDVGVAELEIVVTKD